MRRVPQVLAQLEGILEPHHPGLRGRGNWAAWTQATVDSGEWFGPIGPPVSSAKRKSLTIVDQRRKVKVAKRLFEGGAETQNETRSERQTRPVQQREARAPLEADARRAEA